MTDAQQYVLKHWPEAACHFANLYWPGQGKRKRWIVTRSPIWSGVDGEGLTEVEAWARAANRLEQMLAKEKG